MTTPAEATARALEHIDLSLRLITIAVILCAATFTIDRCTTRWSHMDDVVQDAAPDAAQGDR